jgi:predicted nucleic acid-binding protein
MDDRAGRTEAKSRGLTAIGTAAVVGLAREHRLINSARGILGELVGAGYFIPAEVIEAIARRVDSQ